MLFRSQRVGQALALDMAPEITGKYRVGDIRHCFADISRAQQVLGFSPEVTIEAGIEELAQWLQTASAVDQTQAATQELSRRGLTL